MTDKRDVLNTAVKLHMEGQFERAKVIYEEWLEENAGDASAWHLLGLVCRDLGDTEKAQEFIGKALEIADDVGSFHLAQGVLYQDQRELDKAKQSFLNAVKYDPNMLEGYNALGLLEITMGNLEEAEKHLKTALRIEPESLDTLQHLALVAFDLGKFDLSSSYFQEALKHRPKSPALLASFARTLLAQKAFGLALTTVEKAIEYDSNNVIIYQIQGDILASSNDFGAAEEAYQRCIDLAPDSPGGYRGLGRVRSKLNFYDEAIHWYQQAISKSPGDPVLFHELGHILLKGQYLADAAECFKNVRKMIPGSVPAVQGQVQALMAMDRTHDAIELLLGFAKDQPLNADLKADLANLYARSGCFKDAAHWSAQALADQPKLAEPRLMLAYYQTRTADYASAFDHFNVLEKNNNSAENELGASILTYRALAQDQAGNYSEALELGKKAWSVRRKINALGSAPLDGLLEAWKFKTDIKSSATQDSFSEAIAPVFMFALPGAGLERLLESLKQHPDVIIADERTVFPVERSDFISKGKLGGNVSRNQKQYYNAISRLYPEYTPDKIIVDVLPIGMLQPEKILAIFPHAKMIGITRHKNDLILEFLYSTPMHVYQRLGVQSVEQLTKLASSLTLKLYDWNETLPGMIQNISYAKLAENPEKQLAALQKHLKVDLDAAVIKGWERYQDPEKSANFLLPANRWKQYSEFK